KTRYSPTRSSQTGNACSKEGVRSTRHNVGDQELALLVPRMKRFPNLDTISLAGPRITDAGLANLARLGQLRLVVLKGTAVTGQPRSNLQRVLPKLKIDVYDVIDRISE